MKITKKQQKLEMKSQKENRNLFNRLTDIRFLIKPITD